MFIQVFSYKIQYNFSMSINLTHIFHEIHVHISTYLRKLPISKPNKDQKKVFEKRNIFECKYSPAEKIVRRVSEIGGNFIE